MYNKNNRKNNDRHRLCWVFKRLIKSDYDQHITYKMINKTSYDQTKRGGWHLYTGEDSVDQYIIRMLPKWDTPWCK